jgi:hypothetical protein
LNNISDALERARGDGQALHKRIAKLTDKNRANVQAESVILSGQAHELARYVKILMNGQQADVAQHLKEAASTLEGLANDTRRLAVTHESDLEGKNREALQRAWRAVEKLTQAVAANRSAADIARS